jgi:hypothetical protein
LARMLLSTPRPGLYFAGKFAGQNAEEEEKE